MGKLYLEKADASTAQSHFRQALALGQKMNAFDLMYEPLDGLAAVAEKQKRYDEALKHYGHAIDKIESVRERLKIESFKTQFVEDKLEIYESVITLLIRLGRFEEAYDYLQRFRSRSFLETLSPERIDFAEGIAPKRFARYRFWEQKLREVYDRLGLEYEKGDGKRNDKTIAALNDSLQRIQQEHEKISDEILLHHSRYAKTVGIAQPLSLRAIQQQVLQPGRTLVEYFVGPEIVAAYVIQAQTFHCEVLKVKREELEDGVGKIRAPLKQVKERTIRNLADIGLFDLKLAQQLYERLFQPIEKYLAAGTQLLIVPDGVLHYLPFEALVTSAENNKPDPKVCSFHVTRTFTICWRNMPSLMLRRRAFWRWRENPTGPTLPVDCSGLAVPILDASKIPARLPFP
jgi:pentatricopeptide repeat protein